LAVVISRNSGFVVGWMWGDDAIMHELLTIETACNPTWSSDSTLWAARQRQNRDRPYAGGGGNCSDALPDGLAPVEGDTRLTSVRVPSGGASDGPFHRSLESTCDEIGFAPTREWLRLRR
jgi:hypothetical protein